MNYRNYMTHLTYKSLRKHRYIAYKYHKKQSLLFICMAAFATLDLANWIYFAFTSGTYEFPFLSILTTVWLGLINKMIKDKKDDFNAHARMLRFASDTNGITIPALSIATLRVNPHTGKMSLVSTESIHGDNQ